MPAAVGSIMSATTTRTSRTLVPVDEPPHPRDGRVERKGDARDHGRQGKPLDLLASLRRGVAEPAHERRERRRDRSDERESCCGNQDSGVGVGSETAEAEGVVEVGRLLIRAGLERHCQGEGDDRQHPERDGGPPRRRRQLPGREQERKQDQGRSQRRHPEPGQGPTQGDGPGQTARDDQRAGDDVLVQHRLGARRAARWSRTASR